MGKLLGKWHWNFQCEGHRGFSIQLTLACMVSQPRQPIDTGEDILRRYDAATRPYWLQDWQLGFGGYAKVCEYQIQAETKRKFSVAHVVRPRTETTNAGLCFTLLSKMPTQKPWSRPPDERGPSLGKELRN